MIIDGMEFDDNLSAGDAHENLWRTVLMIAIEEAVKGPSASFDKTASLRARHTEEARAYINHIDGAIASALAVFRAAANDNQRSIHELDPEDFDRLFREAEAA